LKAKLLKDTEVSPHGEHPAIVTREDGYRYFPAGTIIDDHEVYKLVKMGRAVPADEECEKRCNMSAEQMARAQKHYDIVAKGIHPEDYERYQSGEITGYNEDGSYIHGPNWVEDDEDDT